MRALDLVLGSFVPVACQSEDFVVILALLCMSAGSTSLPSAGAAYLPVFRFTLQHHWVLWLADIARILIFDFLRPLLGLDPIIF